MFKKENEELKKYVMELECAPPCECGSGEGGGIGYQKAKEEFEGKVKKK